MPEMAHDELRNAAHAIVARLQADFDAHLERIEQVHTDAREETRRDAEARAEQQWATKLDAERAESQRRIDAALAEARQEAEKRVASETARVRAEMEQAGAQAAARLREEMEAAAAQSAERFKAELDRSLEAERERATNEINAERARLQADVASERDRMAAELETERLKARTLSAALEDARVAAAAAEQAQSEAAITRARVSERQSQLAQVERLLAAVRAIGASRSLSDTLTALTSAAASLAPRVALFIVNDRADVPGGREMQGWRAAGFGDRSPASLRLKGDDAGLVGATAALCRPVSTANSAAPAFASLPRDRAALGVPIIVGGKTVAVLYADDAGPEESEAPASWPEALQVLGAHASAWLTQITAVRTTQAMRATSAGGRVTSESTEDEGSARRYARLLVSEIKLYNEAAVRSGREKRDLLQRLRPEIDRARRLYEERVPPSGARAAYFHDELVHTLADGDATLLGSA
jgi:hypothetical protein